MCSLNPVPHPVLSMEDTTKDAPVDFLIQRRVLRYAQSHALPPGRVYVCCTASPWMCVVERWMDAGSTLKGR